MRHVKKTRNRRMPRILLVAALVAMICVGSVVTVMANTVEVTVKDGGSTYTFSVLGRDPEEILARAETEGMAPVSEIDTYAFDEADGLLTVERAVRVSVEADGATASFVVPKGTKLEDAVVQGGIALGDRDVTEPARDTALLADTAASVTRSSRVFVEADGKRRMLDRLGGTVADALLDAGVTLGDADQVSPAADTPLENGMRIRVARYITVTVTADGETNTHSVSAESYGAALESAGIVLGELDEIRAETGDGEKTVNAGDHVADGAVIRVVRITTEEVAETETIDYGTVYEESGDLYEDETEVKTAGVEGEKEVTYKVVYADGKERSREVLEEKVLKKAEDEVILTGTKERPSTEANTGSGSGSGSSGGSTFVDASGETVSYAYSLYGSCTAYYAEPGAVTSIGATPQVGYVAVDPNLIPYGSLLYIAAPDGSWTYGYCYAMDTGGAAMAGDIVADLYYDTLEDCTAFGRRNMNVYVIRAGW
ncbi:MAG: G5 domain-containing protein [Acutalibacteraceae bacterium]